MYSKIVKQIHNDFYRELVEVDTSENEKAALSKIGFTGVAPKEYRDLFPFHKIIHKNRILKLCEKYDLLYGPIESYAGTIPLKNVKEIESFISANQYFHFYKSRGEFRASKTELFKKDSFIYEKWEKEDAFSFRIVAPSDMMIARENQNRIVVSHISDPVIFAMIREDHRYTYYEDNLNWGIIITAWGEEASDEDIVNEKMN